MFAELAEFEVKDGRIFQQSCVTSRKLQQFCNKYTSYSAAMAFSIEEKRGGFMTEITNNFTKQRLDNFETKLEQKYFELERNTEEEFVTVNQRFLELEKFKADFEIAAIMQESYQKE